LVGEYQCWADFEVSRLERASFFVLSRFTDICFSNYNAEGKPVPIGSATVAGYTWDVYKGPNGDMTVFSFVPAGGKQINSFNGDVNKFFTYLIKSQGLSNKQFLKSVGAGTEPTLGDKAVFTTKGYSVKVNYA
jgi:xyloglucan-specific endo-beta-1,4-glucanase